MNTYVIIVNEKSFFNDSIPTEYKRIKHAVFFTVTEAHIQQK